MPTINELTMLQHLPLEVKVAKTQQRIREWVNFYGKDGVYISFSGGKDSTVLLHLVRGLYGNDIPAVFVNTGLEYPEIVKFVKTFENVEILRPKMVFDEVIKKYGYPMIGKEVACKISYAQKGSKWAIEYVENKKLNNDGQVSEYNVGKYKPILYEKFRISDMCCAVMKKSPIHKYGKKTGRVAILGTLADESRRRKQKWLMNGCNAFNLNNPVSQPLSFWKEQDILQYIKDNKLPICSVYGDIVSVDTDKNQYESSLVGSKLRTTGCHRTGCVFCGFGAHCKGDTRFLDLQKTHPKLYSYCINGGEFIDGIWKPNKEGLGMGYVFDRLNELYGKGFINYK